MVWGIIHTISLIALITGSITDIKAREVPDFLNYSLIFSGLGLRLLYSVINQDYVPILEGFAGFALFFVIAMIVFYTGQFGGGDAKMLMGIGALVGFKFYPFTISQFLISFLVNLLFAGGLYGFGWASALAVKNRKKFVKEAKRLFKVKAIRYSRRAVLVVSALFILIALFSYNELKLFFALLALMVIGSFYLWISARIIEKCCMEKMVPVEKLTEGDWVVKDVNIGRKRICGPKDLGISKQQIQALIKHRKRIPKILIKEGIPFVPSFLIAYLFTMFFGNVVFLLI